MATLFEFLNNNDLTGINVHINNALKNENDLRDFISELLVYCAAIDHKAQPISHPIILINSLKNIIGDNRQSPSRIILEFMATNVAGSPIRESDSSTIEEVAQNDKSASIFFLDLENAIQKCDIKSAHIEAAKIHIVAENSFSILECIAELGLQNIDKLGLYTYHLLRAAVFHSSEENHWTFICSALQSILYETLPEPHKSKASVPEQFIHEIMLHDNPSTLINFSAVSRIYEQDYLRNRAFKREISFWLNTLDFPIKEELNTTSQNDWIRDYYTHPADQIIKTAEKLINNQNGRNSDALVEKLIVLDSIRYLIKLLSEKELDRIDYYIKRMNI